MQTCDLHRSNADCTALDSLGDACMPYPPVRWLLLLTNPLPHPDPLAPGLFECQRTRQAADKLALGGPLAGQAFFITNQDPVPFWSFTGDILEGLGYRRPYIHLPRLLVLAIAILFEYVIRPLLRPFKELTTDFTVFRVNIVTRQRMFSSKKAQGMLGYKPAVSLKEGIQRTVKAFSSLRADAASKAKAA